MKVFTDRYPSFCSNCGSPTALPQSSLPPIVRIDGLLVPSMTGEYACPKCDTLFCSVRSILGDVASGASPDAPSSPEVRP